MLMKKLILTLMLLLAIGLALAVTPVTIYSRPNITFTYNESVYIKSYNLTDNLSNEYALEARPPSDAQHRYETFVFQPINHLMNKQYFLEVVASDFVGNIVTTDYTFIVNAPFMWIRVTKPPLGISPVKPFNVTIQSQNPAYCKYGFTASGTKIFEFYAESLAGQTEHRLKNVGNGSGPPEIANLSADSLTDDLDTYEKTLYLECKETATGRIHPGSVIIGYDPNAPGFREVKATPNPVRDIEEPRANLTVLSNDKVVCKYNNNNFPGSEQETNVSAYKYFHAAIIDYTAVKNETYPLAPHIFNYTVTCKNRAGLTSTTTYTVTVDFDEVFSITMLSPGEYTKQSPVHFTIETGVRATGGCVYSENNGASWMSFDSGSGPKVFTKNLGPLAPGKYDYKVKCVALTTVEKSFTIRVDRTAPGATSIRVDEPVCSLSKLEAEFSANDNANGTGIGYYNYSVLYNGSLVVPWSKSTNGEVSKSLTLRANATYKWQARAVDKAGNEGSLATKDVVARNPNKYLACDKTAPSIDIKSITRNSSTYANVTCTDAQSGCTDKFKYSLVAVNANCTPTTEKTYGYLIPVNRTSDVCAVVFDKASNNKTMEKKIVVGGSCNNRVKDANESDIDCGGPCQGCAINKTCRTGSDCASNNCRNHKCAASGCNDGAKDGDETDVDCGGSCDPCALNKRCEFPVDCMSGFCHNGTCKTPTCSDNILNQGEGDVDCGGPCNLSCVNGKSCRYDTDCQSGNCVNFVCADPTCSDGKKNGLETDVDCGGGVCPRCSLGKDCNMNSDCESKFCENYSCAEKQFKWSFWLLIIGIVLFGGGFGYMLYSRYFKKEETKPGAAPRIQRYTQPQNVAVMPAPRPLSPEELKRRAEAFERAKQVARERALKRRQQRSDIMNAFSKDEQGKTVPQTTKKAEEEKKDVLQDEESGKPKEGFIPLSDLGKASKKSKSLNKQDLEEDVFQKLKAIGPEKISEKKPVAQAKKTPEKKTQSKKKTTKATPELRPPSHPSGLKPAAKEELSDEDIFKKLAQLTGKTNDSVKKAVDKEVIKKDDVMNIFANVTEKKQLDMDVFKAILSTLLSKDKIDKKEVSSILFEFFDKELLTKKELYDTLKELKLV
jgi:hypothetical protein